MRQYQTVLRAERRTGLVRGPPRVRVKGVSGGGRGLLAWGWAKGSKSTDGAHRPLYKPYLALGKAGHNNGSNERIGILLCLEPHMSSWLCGGLFFFFSFVFLFYFYFGFFIFSFPLILFFRSFIINCFRLYFSGPLTVSRVLFVYDSSAIHYHCIPLIFY